MTSNNTPGHIPSEGWREKFAQKFGRGGFGDTKIFEQILEFITTIEKDAVERGRQSALKEVSEILARYDLQDYMLGVEPALAAIRLLSPTTKDDETHCDQCIKFSPDKTLCALDDCKCHKKECARCGGRGWVRIEDATVYPLTKECPDCRAKI